MAAAPAALAGLAAAVAAAPGASAAVLPPAQAPVQAMVHPAGAAAANAAVTVADVVRDLSAAQPKGKHHRTLPSTYTVKSGDTLTSIAQRLYHSPEYWTALYWANHAKVRYADAIEAGQVLAVPAKPARAPKAPTALDPAPAPVQATAATSSGTATTASVTTQSAQSSSAQTATTYSGGSAFQQCVIARESGGNSQAMNASGHYGLYQFSYATWVAYGGNPADFGNASVAEQNQVFANAMAAGGESNWAPYDGC